MRRLRNAAGALTNRPVLPAALAVFLATFAAFSPSLKNGFVDWDDQAYIVENYGFRGLGPAQLKWMFTTTMIEHYQPLTWLSLGVDYTLWGMNPAGYHLSNVLLHSANAALFFLICLLLLGRAGRGRSPPVRTPEKALMEAAVFAALLFAVHPLRVESVAWVSERRDVLSGFFYFTTVLLYLRAREKRSHSPARRRAFVVAVVFYAMSLLAKGVGVTLPAVLVLLDLYPLRRLPGDPRRWGERALRPIWYEKLPFLALAVGMGVIGVLARSVDFSAGAMAKHNALQRAAQAAYGLFFYLYKTVVPLHLLPLYEMPAKLDPFAAPFVLSALFVLALSAAAFLLRRRRPAAGAAWVFYVISLIPMLGIVQFGQQLVADRYSYLPCLGWALLGGALLLRVRASRRTSAAGAAGCLLAVLSALTWRQCLVWRDSDSLWNHTLRLRPDHVVAHIKSGISAEGRGEKAAALRHYRAAARCNPLRAEAHVQLARMLESLGRMAEAERGYREAVRVNPELAEARFRLAELLARTGREAEARRFYAGSFSKAVFRLPRTGDAKPVAAAGPEPEPDRLLAAARERPGDAGAQYAAGVAASSRLRWAEAIRFYRAALRLDPKHAGARNNLGNALAAAGDLPGAERQLLEAVRLRPRVAAAHFNLGNVLALAGKHREALVRYEEALRLDPTFDAARDNRDKLRKYLEFRR